MDEFKTADPRASAAGQPAPPRDPGKVTALISRLDDQATRLHEVLDGVDSRLAPVLRGAEVFPSEPRDEQPCLMAEQLVSISDRLGLALNRLEHLMERAEL